MNKYPAALLFAALVILTGDTAAASLAVGDTFIYRVVNGYSHEARGNIQYHIDKVDADRLMVSFTTDIPGFGTPHAEVYTSDGNWLRHPVTNHDAPTEYEFSPPYPAYVFPLEAGKSWSLRVTATNPATGKHSSVRVDGEVLGSERISTPAGTFDTIKVKRSIYAGDAEYFRGETNISETDWYAPALGRAVRSESESAFRDPGQCQDGSMSYLSPPDSGRSRLLRAAATNPATAQRNSARPDGEASDGVRNGRGSARSDPGRFYGFLTGCDTVRGDWNIFDLIEIRSEKP
jgi:hypothetical protein